VIVVGGEKEQVHIRERGHLAAPVAAHGADSDTLGFGGVGQGVQFLRGQIERGEHHAIGEPAPGAGGGAGIEWPRGKGRRDGRAALVHGLNKDRHGGAAQSGGAVGFAACLCGGRVKRACERARVKDILGREDQVVGPRGCVETGHGGDMARAAQKPAPPKLCGAGDRILTLRSAIVATARPRSLLPSGRKRNTPFTP